MSSPPERIDIHVSKDFPADVALFTIDGVRTLFMRPQEFNTAVHNVRNALPSIPHEAAEQMVRQHPESFPLFDELFGRNDPVPPPVTYSAPPPPPAAPISKQPFRRAWRRKALVVAALLPALAGSWALGRYTHIPDVTEEKAKASAPDSTPGTAESDAGTAKAPFTDPKFKSFSGASTITCDPISTLEAECTDADGMVMSSKAATGPDSTIFTFSYGSERIGLRIFYDAKYAGTWARQDGSRELYPHMEVHGRYVLWGTDSERIAEYSGLLEKADDGNEPVALGGSTPLPPRLAALTLGTLGLDSHEVHQIMAAPPGTTADAPTMLVARLVLGLDPGPTWTGGWGEDIVAIAAGIEPTPYPGSKGTATVPVTAPTPTTPGPVTRPTSGGAGPVTTQPKPPTTTPPAKPKPFPPTTTPGTPNPSTPDPDPGTPDPGTPDPGTPDPGTPDPGTPDPGTPDPGTPDPGTPDPGTPDPGTPDPGTPDPGTPDPGTPDPGTPDPGTPDPGTPDPGTPDPGTPDPGTPDPGTPDPGTPDPGTPDPDTSDPEIPQAGDDLLILGSAWTVAAAT
ncbi:hypothetical protein [Streptomyces longispororuber]|uniref:hypothetical protein n=1 Tax=Streptomyces longispororuber TaxID=68230 RepID=UPI0036F99C49